MRAARDTREVAQVAGPVLSATSPVGIVRAALSIQDGPAPPDADVQDTPQQALEPEPAAPTRCADLSELHGLLDADGLGHRRTEIDALVSRSVRMTEPGPDAAAPGAWVDLAAAATLTDEPSAGAAGPTVMLAQFDLSTPALADTMLAESGWMVLFAERVADDALAAQVTILDQPAGLSPAMRPAELTPHLTLPRVWHQAVQALELSGDEHDAFVRVRDQLATRQGIDPEQGGGASRPYHRLFGYPDETTGAMPGACSDSAGPGDWRLLLQLSTRSGHRVYVWAADGQLERLVGFVR